jgi:DNA replication ATP-dependent helicase Dna2
MLSPIWIPFKLRVTLLQAPPTILPSLEPNTHSCTHCYVNRECMVHAAAEMTCGQNTNNERVLNFRESHGELLSTYTGHLTQEDLAYFREWDRLIDLEADASSHSAATAWLQDSRQRETESGSSIAALIFDGIHPGSQDDAAYLLISFSRSPSSGMSRSFSSLGLTEGTHVIISTDATMFENSKPPSNIQRFRHQHHVIRATLDQIESSKLVVRASIEDLERIQGLVERHQRQVSPSGSKLAFRMDLDRMTAGVGTLRQNLTNLFVGDAIKPRKEEPSEYEMILKSRLPRLRDLLIKGHPPRFMEATASMFHTPRDHIPIPGCNVQALVKEYEGFNPDQRAAVEKVVAAQDYTLIQGLPGTGKTTILSFIARLQALRGLRVLITSYTHAAVDNVALKLMEKGLSQSCNTSGLPPLVRVGQKTSCHADVQPLLADNLAASIGDMPPSSKNLQKVISSARIICTTALSVPRSPLLKDEVFDLVIVDEAGQISQPAILGALMAADRFILVGDHQQLPPLVTSELAEDGGKDIHLVLLKYMMFAFGHFTNYHSHNISSMGIQATVSQ